MVGDESNLSEVVVDAGTDAKARDVSRVDRRFFGGDDFAGEELTSEKNPASDSANTRKTREVRAHNFHSYKKDNTLLARFLAIQIFAPAKNFCGGDSAWHRADPKTATGPSGPVLVYKV